ncbi:MAG: hypothetical protein PWP27_822 [Clostridiales bacterium]|jgi:uncharacterized protein YabE (DUF348 family)|nr:hypothetical protein [Clostridiales bacterium]MDK2933012.1 hypothetical protein [Clostridiales bacterium]
MIFILLSIFLCLTEIKKSNKIFEIKNILGGREMHLRNMMGKTNLSVRTLFLILTIVVSLIASTFNTVIANTKEISLIDEDVVTYAKTLKSTVGEFLKEQGVELYDGDDIQPSLDTELGKHQKIIIERAVPVTVLVDGNEIHIRTYKDTVKDVLEQANIQLNEKDKINYNLADQIVNEMKINIVRVTEQIETVTEKIPFKVVSRANERMDKGKNKIVQEGIEGVREKKFAVVMNDGKEVSRELISDKVISPPVDQIKEYGTVAVHKTSRGETFRYKKVLNMRATAYDLTYESCGKNPGDPGYGITYTGMKARRGVVAVDPKTIPLYSRLYIEAADGSWTYGYAVAGDIGGAVKGNIIDLFYDDPTFVKTFGVKKVKVYILE